MKRPHAIVWSLAGLLAGAVGWLAGALVGSNMGRTVLAATAIAAVVGLLARRPRSRPGRRARHGRGREPRLLRGSLGDHAVDRLAGHRTRDRPLLPAPLRQDSRASRDHRGRAAGRLARFLPGHGGDELRRHGDERRAPRQSHARGWRGGIRAPDADDDPAPRRTARPGRGTEGRRCMKSGRHRSSRLPPSDGAGRRGRRAARRPGQRLSHARPGVQERAAEPVRRGRPAAPRVGRGRGPRGDARGRRRGPRRVRQAAPSRVRGHPEGKLRPAATLPRHDAGRHRSSPSRGS